jgi:hypothetical protein
MELTRIAVAEYVNGFVATGYDRHGTAIMDSEARPTLLEAVNNLLAWLQKTEREAGKTKEEHA